MLVFSIGVDNVFIIVKTFYAKRRLLKRTATSSRQLNEDAMAQVCCFT
jgi:hypothetical protein